MKKTMIMLLSVLVLLAAIVLPAGAAETGGEVSITSASAKVGDTVCLTVSLTGLDKANTIGVKIDAPDGLTFDSENSQWLLRDGTLEDLTATECAWVSDAQDVNGNILTLAYTVDAFKASYPVSATVIVKNDTVTLAETTVTATVSVTNPATAVTLSPSTLALSLGTDTFEGTLTAAVTPVDTTDRLIWSTSDSGVATVRNGIVTGQNTGTATITVRAGSKSASCTVTVTCDHAYEDWVMVKEPTEESEGSRRRDCRFCDHYLTETIPSLKLLPPEITVTAKASTGKPYVTWEKVAGAAKYKVYRSTSQYGSYVHLSTVSGTALTNSSAKVGTKYYYKVTSVSADGKESEYSNVVSCTCKLPSPVVTATNKTSTGKVYLKWDAVSGAEKYQIYRATSEDGEYALLSTTTGTALTNSSTTAGNTYYYKVKAIHAKSAANSAYSEVVSRTCDLPRPTVTITNQSSTGKPYLKWDAVTGALNYNVYRATSKSGTYKLIVEGVTETALADSSAVAGKTYYYKVKAVHENSNATSAYSAYVYRTCDLARPVVTISNKASTGKIVLKWDAVEGASKYQVYRATSKSGTYKLLSTTKSTSLTNTSTTAGKTYYYKVKAIHTTSAANSAYSSVVYRTCDLARPSITVTLNAKDKPVISWKAVTGAVKYEVYRATSEDGEFSKLITTTKLKITNTSAVSGTTYYYKVRAICKTSAGNSAYSTVKSIACP